MVLTDLLARLDGCPVLVVGDLILDEYVWGAVSRVSPEAPVPVVEVRRRTAVAGGAANAAANVSGLGGLAALVGVVGADPDGARLKGCLDATGIDAAGVVSDPGRPTTVKTRVVANGQQVARLDHERAAPINPDVCGALLAHVRRLIPSVAGCVLSDYGKGVVTPELAAGVIAVAAEAGVPLVVDPKGADYRKYRGATVVKPNEAEAARAVGRDLPDDAAVVAAGLDLLRFLGGSTAVLVTRGPCGMTLFEPGGAVTHVPARAREVFDVTGAGDTVAGVLGAAVAAGARLADACRLAAEAAAVVVGKSGTVPIDAGELFVRLSADGGDERIPPPQGSRSDIRGS